MLLFSWINFTNFVAIDKHCLHQINISKSTHHFIMMATFLNALGTTLQLFFLYRNVFKSGSHFPCDLHIPLFSK